MIQSTVCTLEEIGRLFETARSKANVAVADVAEAAGVHQTSVGRWISGSEPGARSFALACLRIGKTPNDFLFREQLPNALPVLNLSPEGQSNLLRIARVFVKMAKLAPDSLPMDAVFAAEAEGALAEAEAYFERKRLAALPMGSTVEHITPEERVFNAPPTKADRTRSGDTGKSDRLRSVVVSDDEAPYGRDAQQ